MLFGCFVMRVLSLQSNVHVHDLYTDLADGRILVRFLEIISGDKLGTVGKAVFTCACTSCRQCIDDSNRKSCNGGCIGNVDSETVWVGHSLDWHHPAMTGIGYSEYKCLRILWVAITCSLPVLYDVFCLFVYLFSSWSSAHSQIREHQQSSWLPKEQEGMYLWYHAQLSLEVIYTVNLRTMLFRPLWTHQRSTEEWGRTW